jgi:hypothetical protein
VTQREAFAGRDRLRYGGRDAATGAAVRPPDLAVVRQDGIDHDLLSVMFLIVTRMSLSSSPVCGLRMWGPLSRLPIPPASPAC